MDETKAGPLSEGRAVARHQYMDTQSPTVVMVEIHCGRCHNYITTLPYEWAAGAIFNLCASCAKKAERKIAPWDRKR